MDLSLVVELKGRDRLEVTSLKPFKMKVIGCEKLFAKLSELKKQFGPDVSTWALQKSHDHASLLINELILKLQNKWEHPYKEDEVCHCRNISLEVVEQAIMMGAETPEMVSKWTSASTACGTCRPDVEKTLKFRLR
jgi:bacterioferritin-associated ferredoxin